MALATGCLSLLADASAFGRVLRGQAAMGDWRDDKPGLRRLITAQDLPAVAKPTTVQAKVVPMPPDARPQLPDGFTAELVTTDTHKPRVIRVAPNGDLFVADRLFGSARVRRVPAGSAKPAKDENVEETLDPGSMFGEGREGLWAPGLGWASCRAGPPHQAARRGR